MKLMMDAEELSAVIKLSVATIYQYASKNPERLPPRLVLPGRQLVWAVKDVERWVDQHSSEIKSHSHQ